MKNEILLIEDVEHLGRSGQIVSVKSGYARNYLLPQRKGVFTSKSALRMQAALQEKRNKQAVADKEEAMLLAAKIQGARFVINVKVDPAGHMYGSVSATDIAARLVADGFEVNRSFVPLPHPFKELGEHSLTLRLKEGVLATIIIAIVKEEGSGR